MEAHVDQRAQHSRRNCLLFHEIKEKKVEDTDSIIINTIKEEMDTEILPNDLDRLHRIGNPKTKKKQRPTACDLHTVLFIIDIKYQIICGEPNLY